jgi:hypothetical protein
VTLVEMLVTLAVLLLMMTVIVQIFQAATGALNTAQITQQLDGQLRLLDVTLRADLAGVTARMTPPNDPKNNTGYLEYGENEFADLQGEDGDDYIRFTAKAPAGRPFTGRVWTLPMNAANLTPAQVQALWPAAFQPITITSEYAEIIYFLRNGNLYRRVFLVAPERASSLVPTVGNTATVPSNAGPVNLAYTPAGLGGQTVSWQGVNDLSARPASTGTTVFNTGNSVVLNTLGDLTNREKRAFYQRFASDFQLLDGTPGPDGLDDDFNKDNVPDYYPTLYRLVFSAANPLIFEPPFPSPALTPAFRGLTAFPFVFSGAYSAPQTLNAGGAPVGWIHSPNPVAYDPNNLVNPNVYFDINALGYLRLINHNPIDIGDNLVPPGTAINNNVIPRSTWWGFPTWRETLSPSWNDPTVQVNLAHAQPNGLVARSAGFFGPGQPIDPTDANLLPPMIQPGTFTGDFTLIRQNPDGYSDGLGVNSAFWGGNTVAQAPLWAVSWEDDLIMTGVRSFDIKAYDNSLSQYVDLGWGDDPRLTGTLVGAPGLGSGLALPFLDGNYDAYGRFFRNRNNPNAPIAINAGYNAPAHVNVNGGRFDLLNETLAHEGRIPPLLLDNRLDASYPNAKPSPDDFDYANLNFFNAQYPAPYQAYSSNIGDDDARIVRLRRVWDSWSTDYTRAPANGVFPNGFPAGPNGSTPPIYPSYPPPYPAPLRGIQIQIRVVDPGNQRIKTLTIRQDFTDKL